MPCYFDAGQIVFLSRICLGVMNMSTPYVSVGLQIHDRCDRNMTDVTDPFTPFPHSGCDYGAPALGHAAGGPDAPMSVEPRKHINSLWASGFARTSSGNLIEPCWSVTRKAWSSLRVSSLRPRCRRSRTARCRSKRVVRYRHARSNKEECMIDKTQVRKNGDMQHLPTQGQKGEGCIHGHLRRTQDDVVGSSRT